MAQRLPLMLLPMLAFRAVLEHMKPMELFLLSVLNRNVRRMIEKMRLRYERLSVCHITEGPDENYNEFDLVLANGSWMTLVFESVPQPDFRIHIDGLSLALKYAPEKHRERGYWFQENRWFVEFEDVEKAMGVVTKWMFGLFPKGGPIWYYLEPDALTDFKNYLISPERGNYQKMVIGEQALPNAVNMEEWRMGSMKYNPISHENLRFVVENVPVHVDLHINADAGIDFHCEKDIFRRPRLNIESCSWVKMDQLVGMECEHLRLGEDCQLRVDDLALFVERWFEGDMPKLRSFEAIVQLIDWSTLRMSDVTKGIEVMKFDGKRRGSRFPGYTGEWWCDDDFVDIQRPDGLLASILFSNQTFRFCVWHERFP